MNIFVAGLNYSTSSESLGQLFAECGEVTSAKVITDRETGRSRGFGFVEMANDEEGQAAIDKLNETEFEGKTISVSVAHERKERRDNGGYNRRRY
jgi:RNA recognition motif-containing protein